MLGQNDTRIPNNLTTSTTVTVLRGRRGRKDTSVLYHPSGTGKAGSYDQAHFIPEEKAGTNVALLLLL